MSKNFEDTVTFEDVGEAIRQAGLRSREMAEKAKEIDDELSMCVFYGQAAFAAYLLESLAFRMQNYGEAEEAFQNALASVKKKMGESE